VAADHVEEIEALMLANLQYDSRSNGCHVVLRRP
jgi:hypothetical protein